MDKDALEILNRQDKYSQRMFYLSIALAVLVLVSIINNSFVVRNMAITYEETIVQMQQADADKETEMVRLYFETDYDVRDYNQTLNNTIDVK